MSEAEHKFVNLQFVNLLNDRDLKIMKLIDCMECAGCSFCTHCQNLSQMDFQKSVLVFILCTKTCNFSLSSIHLEANSTKLLSSCQMIIRSKELTYWLLLDLLSSCVFNRCYTYMPLDVSDGL